MERKEKEYLSSGLWLFLYYMVENGIEKSFQQPSPNPKVNHSQQRMDRLQLWYN
jgi:hypothetical protein